MNLAILLRNNFDFGQLSYNASTQINSFAKTYSDSKIVTCCLNNNQPAFKVKTANVPLTDLNMFDGLIITTCIDTTLFAKNMVKNNDVLFYVWDLEWLRKGKKDYFKNIDAFRNVLLATRSQAHAIELMKYSGVMTKLITPNFNIPHLINGYQQYRKASGTNVPTGR